MTDDITGVPDDGAEPQQQPILDPHDQTPIEDEDITDPDGVLEVDEAKAEG